MNTTHIRQTVFCALLVAVAAVSYWFGASRSGSPTVAVSPEVIAPAPAAVVADASAPAPVAAVDPAPALLAVPAKRILPALTDIEGSALDPNGAAVTNAGMTGEKARGRSADIASDALASLADVAEGDVVSIPTFDGEVRGVVEVAIVEEGGWRRVGGPIDGDRNKGWFTFGYNGEQSTGRVLMADAKLANHIEAAGAGRYKMVERSLRDTICLGLPNFAAAQFGAARAPSAANPAAGAAVVTPILNSRPAATAVILMDFDGENVNDPDWGRINASASPLTAAQRADVFRRVRDDFLQFNINVTTDPAKYAASPVGDRMRCIVTTVDTAAPGAGGVAFLNSFAYAGTIFSANVPCWCFNPTVKSIADTISHEIGHTLALRHDGLVGRAEYYFGHGTGAVGWGPIMGAPFTKNVSQWSRGEYRGANNYEFDVHIIANTVNGFGFAPDDCGDTPATASPLSFTGDVIEQRGVIDKLGDLDVYSFNAPRGGNMLVTAAGIGNQVGNLDVRIEVLSRTGVVLGDDTKTGSLGAGLSVLVPAGVNYIRIRAAGDGNVDTTGYSAYGSGGSYTITGRLP